MPPLTGKLRPKPENIGPMALRSKEPAPEERGAVKILHAGLLLQGPPPASTRKGRRLLERNVVAPDRKSASETRRH